MSMLEKLSLKEKAILFIIGGSLLVYIVVLVGMGMGFYHKSVRETQECIDIHVLNKTYQIAKEIDRDMGITRTVAQSLAVSSASSESERIEQSDMVLKKILAENPQFDAVWVSWELQAIRKDWPNPFGRKKVTFYNKNGLIREKREELNLNGDDKDGFYYRLKVEGNEELSKPTYYNNFRTDEGDSLPLLGISIRVPLVHNGGFLGVVGADMSIKRFEDWMSTGDMKTVKEGYAVVASNDGTIAYHSSPSLINKNMDSLDLRNGTKFELFMNIMEGDNYKKNTYELGNKKKLYLSFAPMRLGRFSTPWTVGFVIPHKELTKSFYSIFLSVLGISILAITLLSFLFWRAIDDIISRLFKMRDVLEDLSKGRIDLQNKLMENTSELGKMAVSVNALLEGLNEKAKFSEEIGQGHLDVPFELKHEGDILGKSLLDMQTSLKKNEEAARQRRWASEGLTKFADLTQLGGENIQEYCATIASELVKYVDAAQAGVFLLNDEEEGEEVYLELSGSYAYDRRKYNQKKIYLKEGLVGQCVLEKAPVYLLDIPQDYLNITSGLGKSNPSCLLIVPLMVNEEVFGAIEIASFHSFEQYRIDFMEKLAENVAASISSVKITQKTKLLLVQSREQAEELRAQEEEMRQNMEELQATQEELSRKGKDTEKTLEEMTLWQTNVRAILNGLPYGIIVMDMVTGIEDVNKSAREFLGVQQEDMLGKSIEEVFVDIDIETLQAKVGEKESPAQVKTAKGEVISVELYLREIHKAQGKRLLMVFREKLD